MFHSVEGMSFGHCLRPYCDWNAEQQ
jgi:hypothetical protein